ncbi:MULTISPECIES: hypothetical protein [Streptomyces]|uniref:DUF4365 domain-containing protein n=1 Tax=Streptomyces pseudogriseolus TaxID=36817 RepID=A0ABQ2T191_STREZ|nr:MULTISPECIES: hypothetical protein [Streptomyces]GGS48121.1 hypothetical protein GCM10010285_29410 [Streptomyces rubiginosus]
MVSPPHEAMHRIFRHDPDLFGRLAPRLGIAVPPIVETTPLLSAVDGSSPVACSRNTQLHVRTAGQEEFQLLIEAQDRRDPARPAHWAHHVAYIWTQRRLPTCLLIVCADEDTARWAEQPVSSAPAQPPALTLHPFVAGPHNLPLVTDPDEVRADPELAALSVMLHPTDAHVGTTMEALSAALRDRPEAIARPLIDLTAISLQLHPAGRAWRELVLPAIREWERGRGRIEGGADSARESLLIVLGSRGFNLPRDVRERVAECQDPELLRHWLARAVTASRAEDVFVST